MSPAFWQILLFTTAAGAAIPAGGWLARVERIRPAWLENEFRHGVIAFGGGVLLAAVSLVLVPEGTGHLPPLAGLAAVAAGGAAAMALERWLARRGEAAPQLIAMLADFVPEALALGAVFATNRDTGMLLALLIALQNLPEGFNAWRELAAGKRDVSRRPFLWLAVLVPLGPASGLAGHYLLGDRAALMGLVMLFAAGSILYITFGDIAPQARLKKRWAPPLGAVLGFLVGLAGHMGLQALH